LIGEWLDEHFPVMLEDAVRGEVARVAKTRLRR
jgi:cell pole-organizing protein PopZ